MKDLEYLLKKLFHEFLKRTWSKSLVFRNYFFLWISTLQSPNQKTELDGMFIFYADFFTFSFCPIKSVDLQNTGFQSKIWTRYQFEKYQFEGGRWGGWALLLFLVGMWNVMVMMLLLMQRTIWVLYFIIFKKLLFCHIQHSWRLSCYFFF